MSAPAFIDERRPKFGPRNLPAEERFWLRVKKGAPNECWDWQAVIHTRGYGYFYNAGRSVRAHRFAMEVHLGRPLLESEKVCHHCDNPRCVNPAHLYLGDAHTNMQDVLARGRHWTQRNPDAAKEKGLRDARARGWVKLSPEQAREIAASGEQTKILAARYQVDRSTIIRIRRGATWNSL